MSFKQVIFILIGVLAITACGLMIYGYLHEGWRLDSRTLSGDLFSSGKPERDERIAARHWDVDLADSCLVVVEGTEVDLEIRGGEGRTATVDALLEGEGTDSAKYRITVAPRDGRELRIVAKPIAAFAPGTRRNKIIIRLGIPTRLMVHLGSGDVAIDQFRGSLATTVEKGNINVESAEGILKLTAREGRIAAQRCRGPLAVESQGDVSLNYDEGETTVDAAARVIARNQTGTLAVSVLSGGISASMIGLGRQCRLTALDGDIRLETLPGIRASFNVSAARGQILYRLPFDSTGLVNTDPHGMKATMNGGGVPITIDARRGDVSLDEFTTDPSLP